MMKYKMLTAALLASAVLAACSSGSAKPAPKKFAWQQSNDPGTISCVRSGNNQAVDLKAGNLDMTVIQNKGCFNGDSKFCDLRIYQVMVESFRHGAGGAPGVGISWGPSSHRGNLKGIIDSLDYIKSTGANAVWLTPVFTTEKIEGQDETYDKLDGTGYFTSDYFSVDPRFGTADELKKLVKLAHDKGLRVFLDGVFGHAKTNVKTASPGGNTLVPNRMCRDLGGNPDKMSLRLGTCFKPEESSAFFQEVATYWIREAKIDGWRLDQAYQLSSEQWKPIRDAIEKESAKKSNAYSLAGKKTQPLGYTLGEVWSGNPRHIELNAFSAGGIASAFNFPLRDQLVRILATDNDPYQSGNCSRPLKSLNDEIIPKMRGYSHDAIMNNFITNHDTVRFGDLLQRSTIEKDGAKGKSYYDAHLAVYGFLAAMSGPLTVYYGDETGDDLAGFSLQPDNCAAVNRCNDHVSRTDGHVDSLTADEKNLKENIAKVLKLRDAHPALARGSRTHLYSDHTLYADLKQYRDDRVIFVLNSGSGDRTVTLEDSVWQKLGLGASCALSPLFGGGVEGNAITAPALSGTFVKVSCK